MIIKVGLLCCNTM